MNMPRRISDQEVIDAGSIVRLMSRLSSNARAISVEAGVHIALLNLLRFDSVCTSNDVVASIVSVLTYLASKPEKRLVMVNAGSVPVLEALMSKRYDPDVEDADVSTEHKAINDSVRSLVKLISST